MNIYKQFQDNTAPSVHFRKNEDLSFDPPSDYPVKFIAFYLPQFHSIAENDEWWGAGFTEWTNVTKAIPRYKGHLQPRLPSALGFYDLSNPETLYKQAELARRGGIYGFCLHDYWFSGRKVLEKPLELILRHTDLDFRFCLNWANENWSRRWDGSETDILLEQKYDPTDLTGYVRSILPALRDPRYIRIEGRPLISIYRPELLPEPQRTFEAWRTFLEHERVGNPLLVRVQNFKNIDPRLLGMDAVTLFPPHAPNIFAQNDRDYRQLLDFEFNGHVRDYRYLADAMLDLFSTEFTTFPGVAPGWDNEARKPRHGVSFAGADPRNYGAWLAKAAAQVLAGNRPAERLVFINAWNEWAEGAILEPDRHFGYGNLAQTRQILDLLVSGGDWVPPSADEQFARKASARFATRVQRKLRKISKRIYSA